MPVVRIEWLPGRTPAMKQAMVDRIVDAFVDVCGVDPEVVEIMFVAVEPEEWFAGRRSFAARGGKHEPG